jgi:signal transduction histidine kinase
VAVGLVAVMVGWSALVSVWPRYGPVLPILAPWVVATELVIGATVLVADGWVYDPGRPISLPWSWPATGVMAAGVLYGWRVGLGAALVIGASGLATEFRLDTNLADPVHAFSRMGLWVATGLMAGYVSARLREAEAEVALARAREEVTRRLHDGVLQTLAVIQRRSDDTELAALAREQEDDLRQFLAGARSGRSQSPTGADQPSLDQALRSLAGRHRRHYPDNTVRVVLAPDAPEPPAPVLEALVGAVGEALTNTGKHAQASTVTVYGEPVDPDGSGGPPSSGPAPEVGLFVSVKDNGRGFDAGAVTERIGLARSIRGRIAEVGGMVEIDGRPGRGAEVKIWV